MQAIEEYSRRQDRVVSELAEKGNCSTTDKDMVTVTKRMTEYMQRLDAVLGELHIRGNRRDKK